MPRARRRSTPTGSSPCPGLVDLHTHLREPGFEQSETVLTGTRAAAAGGFTAVFAMANTFPVADTAGVVEQVASARRAARLRHGAADRRGHGRPRRASDSPRSAPWRGRARTCGCSATTAFCVSDPLLMRRALEYVKAFDGVIAQHAQEPRLTEGAQMNEGALSGELGLAGWPAVAEESIIARDVLLAEHVGSRLHVCHVSTAGIGRGDPLGEGPRHRRHRRGHPAPPAAHRRPRRGLRRALQGEPAAAPRPKTSLALRAALADGTIDIVATDHAPHPVEAKECAWDAAANGMVGLEIALSRRAGRGRRHRAHRLGGCRARAVARARARSAASTATARPFAVGSARRPHALRPVAVIASSIVDRLAGKQRQLALPRARRCPDASSRRPRRLRDRLDGDLRDAGEVAALAQEVAHG